jgi:exoribonuclease R
VLITLGQHCSDKEQNAEFAERETIKIKILHFLKKKIGETLQGVISGVTPKAFTSEVPNSRRKALFRFAPYPTIATAMKNKAKC